MYIAGVARRRVYAFFGKLCIAEMRKDSFLGTLPVNKLCFSIISIPPKRKGHTTSCTLCTFINKHNKRPQTKHCLWPKQSIVYRWSDKRVQKPKAVYICPGLFTTSINFPKRLRTMFRDINLCGAESNTELPEQHCVHLSCRLYKLYAGYTSLSS